MTIIIAGISKILSGLLSQNAKMTSRFPYSLKFVTSSRYPYFGSFQNTLHYQSRWLSFNKLLRLAFSFQFARPENLGLGGGFALDLQVCYYEPFSV